MVSYLDWRALMVRVYFPTGAGARIRVVSLNCRDKFPQTMDKDTPERAMYLGKEAERERATVWSSSRHDIPL